MSECRDKRLGDMLHHYELGLLSDTDREEFELHLMECDYCLEKANRFSPAARHIRFNPQIREIIGAIDDERSAGKQDDPVESAEAKPRGRFTPFVIPAFVAAVAVFLILIFKPWHIEISPTDEAYAAGNRLAVMYFENLVDENDPERLGPIITSLLITDLSESQYIHVVSTQHLHDIMRLLEHEKSTALDRDIASRVAEKAMVRWIMTGNILQLEPELILRYEIMEVSSGNVVASETIHGLPDENIFSIVDRFTVDIKRLLPLPADAENEPDRQVADVTTHSEEAYRYYLEGIELVTKVYNTEAIEKFEKAVEYDSTFAMAYYYLSRYKSREYIDRAVKYSANCTKLEKLYIETLQASINADYELYTDLLKRIIELYPEEKDAYLRLGAYYYQLGEYEEALEYIASTVKIDPLNKRALNWLTYIHDRLGNFEYAIVAINKYIELYPDEANPYDSRADLYGRNGRLELAIASYRKALEVKPDFYISLLKLGHMYLYSGELEKADSCYGELIYQVTNSTMNTSYRFYPTLIPYYRGLLNETLRAFDRHIEYRVHRDPDANTGFILRLKAFIYQQQGNSAAAIEELEKSMTIYKERSPNIIINDRHFYAQLLAENGEFQKAEEVAENLRIDLEASPLGLESYWYALGAIDMARGNYESAVEFLENAIERTEDLPYRYLLGRAYLQTGRLSQAVKIFEKGIGIYDDGWRLCVVSWNMKLHYYLGMAYEQSQWTDKAIEQYEIFIDRWGNGDPGIAEIEDARVRLARLKSKS